jgi:hypothetical protein
MAVTNHKGVIQALIVVTVGSLLLFALILPKLQSSFASADPSKTSFDLASEIAKDLAAIPAYSNAKAITSKVPGAGLNDVNFETTDSVSAVISFYDKELTSMGWSIYKRWSDASVEYQKRSDSNVPYTPHVLISVLPYGTADDASKRISIAVGRYPDPNRIPLYQNPRNVQTRDDTTQGAVGTVIEERVITYETDSSAQSVLAAYKSALPLFGWTLASQSGSLTYRFKVDSGEYSGERASVVITANERAGRSTQVALRIRGNMLVPVVP